MVVEEKWVGFVGNVVEMMVYGAIRPVGMERSFAYLPVGFAHLCSSFSQIMPKCEMEREKSSLMAPQPPKIDIIFLKTGNVNGNHCSLTYK